MASSALVADYVAAAEDTVGRALTADEHDSAASWAHRSTESDVRRRIAQMLTDCDRVRFTDDTGRQIVKVEDRWSYVWDGPGYLDVGDRVKLPHSGEAGSRPWFGTVTGFGTDYDGPLRAVLSRGH